MVLIAVRLLLCMHAETPVSVSHLVSSSLDQTFCYLKLLLILDVLIYVVCLETISVALHLIYS